MALNPIFKLFLKSKNLNDLTISPKSHSTDTRTELMDALKAAMSSVKTASLKGACKWILKGYAGSPYMQSGCPAGVNACLSKSTRMEESLSIPASCLFPSTVKNNILNYFLSGDTCKNIQ